MARYFVGDIQGCLDELQLLLSQVAFDPACDELWLTGDLVARGPKSLETLRYIKSLKASAKTVLGNHDLHLIATYLGIKAVKPNDRLDDLLAAPDAAELIDWLIQQPLLRTVDNVVLTHAGISPQWTVAQAIELADEAQLILQSEQSYDYLANMYHNEPTCWQNQHQGFARFRYIVNSLTRMRFCYPDASLDFVHKGSPHNNDNKLKLVPWFHFEQPDWSDHRLIFGHWASLMGQTGKPHIIALDTGCVWGQYMTMLRLDDNKTFTAQPIGAKKGANGN